MDKTFFMLFHNVKKCLTDKIKCNFIAGELGRLS